jgi:hypothetical protein
MPIVYLIFGHLAADFILQPDELVKWKHRDWRGGAFHALIHFLFYLAVFFTYLADIKVVLTLACVAIAHFFIDSHKIWKETKKKDFAIEFFLDQLVHFLTILVAGLLIWDSQPTLFIGGFFDNVFHDFYVLAGLSLMIIVTYAVEVAKFQFMRKKKNDLKYKPDYRAMARRVMIFSLIYGLLMVFCAYRTAAFI